jgi:hypothetical protein
MFKANSGDGRREIPITERHPLFGPGILTPFPQLQLARLTVP